MPLYRKHGIGKKAAFKIFSLYKGKWEVRQLAGLEMARNFWRNAIKEYTDNKFSEIEMNSEQWVGTVQYFSS